jgi:hypothetical protein
VQAVTSLKSKKDVTTAANQQLTQHSTHHYTFATNAVVHNATQSIFPKNEAVRRMRQRIRDRIHRTRLVQEMQLFRYQTNKEN